MKKFIRGFLCGLGLILIIGATQHKNPSTEDMKQEPKYVISTCVHTMGKDIWVFETKMNAKTGKIISRKQVHSKKYRNIK